MKRLLRKLLKTMTPAFAVAILVFIGATTVVPGVSAQVLRRGGGGVLSRDFWAESNGVLTPTNPNATLGSSSDRIAGIYTDTLDALTLTISGSVPGNLTVTGTISVLGSGTSTFAGPISSGTVSSTRVQSYRYDFSDSGNIRWEQIPGVSQAKLTQGTVDWITVQAGSGGMILRNAQLGTTVTAQTDGGASIGSASNRIANGWFSGTVTSTIFSAPDGSATAPSFSFGSQPNMGIYRSAANTMALAVGNSPRLLVATSAIVPYQNLEPISDGSLNIGVASSRFRNGWFSDTVTSTEFVVPSGGGLTFNGSGSVGSGTLQLCFDDGSDLCNDGITMLGVDTIVQVSNGAELIRYLPGQTQFSGGVYSRTDGGNDLGIPALRWRNGAFSGTVTSSQAVVTGITTGTSIGTVCVNANKELILCP